MRTNALLTMLLAPVVLTPASISAVSLMPHPVQCPAHYTCNISLGVGIRLPSTWLAMPKGKEGPDAIAFARRPVVGQNYDERLIIKLAVVGNSLNNRRLARDEANRLIAGLHANGVTPAAVRYGGSLGFLLRGLPPTPSPATDVVLAHLGYVYLLIAPGRSLAADQRQALQSLRFFVPQGALPSGTSAASLPPQKMLALYFADLNAHRFHAAWRLEAPCGISFSTSNGPGAPAGTEGFGGRGNGKWSAPRGKLARHPILASVRVTAIKQLHIPNLERHHILAFGVSGWYRFDYSAVPWANDTHRSGFHVIKLAMWKCSGHWGIESGWLSSGGGDLNWT